MGASHSIKKNQKKFSPAVISGIIFLAVAAAVFFINPFIAAAFAFLYILLCVLGCFFPQTNFLFPVISRGNTGKKFVALTFDDGPSELITKKILALLDKYNAKATFFVSGINAQRHTEIIKEIIGRGHTIGNRSDSHNPFLMLKSSRRLTQEIVQAQKILRKMGMEALAFRPPVGIVNPKLGKVLDELEMFCVTFNRRAGDAGNRFVKSISKKILNKIKPGDIILLHDVPARTSADNDIFLAEVEKILAGIDARELAIVPLSILINKEIMAKTKPA